MDDIDLIITVVSDTSEDIFQQNEAKQETMYDRIEKELKGVQQALYSSHVVSTASLSSGGTKVGDEPTQLWRLSDVTKAHLHRVQEEKEGRGAGNKQRIGGNYVRFTWRRRR